MARNNPFRSKVVKSGGDERLLADSRGSTERQKELRKELNNGDF